MVERAERGLSSFGVGGGPFVPTRWAGFLFNTLINASSWKTKHLDTLTHNDIASISHLKIDLGCEF